MIEIQPKTVYHAQPLPMKRIEKKRMFTSDSNLQEGIGIYFGSLDVASHYGEYVYSTQIDDSKYLESRNAIGDEISIGNIREILRELLEKDKESMYALVTDYGIEPLNPENISDSNIKELARMMESEEVRNFQIELAQAFSPEHFIQSWGEVLPQIEGTKNSELGFYAILNENAKITPFSEKAQIDKKNKTKHKKLKPRSL